MCEVIHNEMFVVQGSFTRSSLCVSSMQATADILGLQKNCVFVIETNQELEKAVCGLN